MDKRRKYKYDENYFAEINSKEKAYWLGFIMADGYLYDNTKRQNKSSAVGMRIRLSVKDSELLEKLNKDMKCDKPIKTVKNYGKYGGDLAEFQLNSRHILDDLRKIGYTCGNKSGNEFLIKFNNSVLTKNFILGIFDGDGSVSINNGGRTAEWQIVSSLKLCEEVQDFLLQELPEIKKFQAIHKNNRNKDNELYRLRTGSKQYIRILYDYFYNSDCSSSFLERKRSIMKDV
jgi:hypothetical protein